MSATLTMADLEILLTVQVSFVEERIQRGLPVAKALENAARTAHELETPTKTAPTRKKLRPNEEVQRVRRGPAVRHDNGISERLRPQARRSPQGLNGR